MLSFAQFLLTHPMHFLLTPFCPHQNRIAIELISAHSPAGNIKQLIAYVGIACMTALMRISLPACDKNFSFHPCKRRKILSLISLNASFLERPRMGGSPKYLSNLVEVEVPKNDVMDCLTT